MNKDCPKCKGMGWYWAEFWNYGKKGEFSRPCPTCNPIEYAKWKEAGDKGKAVNKWFDEQKSSD